MTTTIDERLFIEQVLESVASIQKHDHVDDSLSKIPGGIASILGSIVLNPVAFVASSAASVSIIGAIAGGISGKDFGDIPINQFEEDKEVKIAIETVAEELFDYDQEKGAAAAAATHPRKIKKIITDSLCPSLLKTSDDVFEIAKSSTPVLLTLSLSGTISLPIQPVFFAAAAILLTRSSIAAICKGSNQSASK